MAESSGLQVDLELRLFCLTAIPVWSTMTFNAHVLPLALDLVFKEKSSQIPVMGII